MQPGSCWFSETYPIDAKALPEIFVESKPRTEARPLDARKIFMRVFIRVVFPAPLGAARAWTPPCRTQKSSTSNAFTRPDRLVNASVSHAPAIIWVGSAKQ